MKRVLAAACLVALGGCGDDRAAVDDGGVPDAEPDYPPAPAIDLLFVLDNSGTQEEELVLLAQAMPALVDELERLHGSIPDLHAGVITTDMGAGGYSISFCDSSDEGRLQTNGCAMLAGAFLEDRPDGAGGRTTNYTGTLGDALACVVALPTSGCGFQQPLAALRASLTHPDNAGFLRDDAALAIVYLGDEEDCSTLDTTLFDPSAEAEAVVGPLSSFRCFEHGVLCDPDEPRAVGEKTGCAPRVGRYFDHPAGLAEDLLASKPAGWLVVHAIRAPAGPIVVAQDPEDPEGRRVAPTCQSKVGASGPSVRMETFLDAFGARATRSEMCDLDHVPAMRALAAEIAGMLE